jgi:hypothetical protein
MYFAFVIGDPFVVKKTFFLPDLAVGRNDVIGVL